MCVISPYGEKIRALLDHLNDDFEIEPNADDGRECVIVTPFTRSDRSSIALSLRVMPECGSIRIDDERESLTWLFQRGIGEDASMIAVAKRVARKNGVKCDDSGLLYAYLADATAGEALLGVIHSAIDVSALAYGCDAFAPVKPRGLCKAGQRELIAPDGA